MKATMGLAGLLCGLMSMPAMAEQFIGTLYVSSAAVACSGFPSAKQWFDVSYFPRNHTTNGDTTILTISGIGVSGFRMSYQADAINLVGTTFRPVEGNVIFGGHNSFTSQMRITSQVPAPTAATKAITLAGNINNFNGRTGCNVVFQATVYDYP